MSEGRFKQHEIHCRLGDEVLSAWFDDARFRAAWVPDMAIFALGTQKAIAKIAASRGAALDLDGLVLALDRSGQLKTWEGGVEALIQQLRAPFALEPWAKLEQLRQVAGLRQLRDKLLNAVSDIDGGGGLDEVRGRVAEAARAADAAAGAKVRTVKQVIGSAYEIATGARGGGMGQRTISKKLDAATGGLKRKVVWVVAAGTSWGKTSFLCALADQCLKDGGRPLIISFEDPEEIYGARLLQIRTGANAMRVRDATLLPTEVRYVTDAYASAEESPVFLDAVGRPAEAVAADIRSLVKGEGITAVFGDYVQAMRAKDKQQDRRLDVYYCGRIFTDAVKESDTAGVMFSQLTVDQSTGKMRARDCEDLHNAAEVLLFGKQEEEALLGPNGQQLGKKPNKSLWADKVKQGPAKFSVDLEWDMNSACFRSEYGDMSATGELRFGGFDAGPESESYEERYP